MQNKNQLELAAYNKAVTILTGQSPEQTDQARQYPQSIPDQMTDQQIDDLLIQARASDPFEACAFSKDAISALQDAQRYAIKANGDYKRLMRQWIKRHPRTTGLDTIPHFDAKYFD